jgi:hypothetical protein
MPHHNQSIREWVIALVEGVILTTAEAGKRCGVNDRTAMGWIERYLVSGETSRRAGMGFWSESSQAEDAWLVDEVRGNTFFNSVQLKRNTTYQGCPRTVRNRKMEAGLRSRSAAV